MIDPRKLDTVVAFDPGVNHVAVSVGLWQGLRLVGLPFLTVATTENYKNIAPGRDRAHATALRMPYLIQDVNKALHGAVPKTVIVEGQHFYALDKKGKRKTFQTHSNGASKGTDPHDIRDLAKVSGAICASCQTLWHGAHIVEAPTGSSRGSRHPRNWSWKNKTKQRHPALEKIHLRDSYATIVAPRVARLNKRHREDVLDTIAMQVWAQLGFPINGV